MVMNIKEFLDKYGLDTTTNFQLLHYAKELNIKPFYYVMCNEVETLKRKYEKGNGVAKPILFAIANYQSTKERGSHHVALYKNNDKVFYFDSFGVQPDFEVLDFLEEGVYSKLKIQEYNTRMCGQLAIYVLYRLSRGCDFFTIVLDMYDYFNSQ
jgi:hypothetical protein